MKKSWILLCLAVVFLLCSCQNSSVPSNIVDSENVNNQKNEQLPIDKPERKEDIPVILFGSRNFKNNRILQYAQYLYEDFDVKFEFLPKTASEREAALSSLRVDIMAGGGPDAFILPTNEPGVFLDDDSPRELPFMNVEKQMRSGVFLPMDAMISESDHINMDNHYDVIINAGKTEEGQMVLPLLFSYNVFFLDKTQLKNPDMQINTWDDIANCGDEKVISFLGGRMIRWYGAQNKDFVDYKTEKLLLSADSIAHDMSVFTNTIIYPQDELAAFEVAQHNVMNEFALAEWSSCSDSAYSLPIPNKEGGLTAYITAFAAINRNTRYAEEVFQFIELFFNDEIQSNMGVAVENEGSITYYGSYSRPKCIELGSISGVVTGRNAYSEQENEFLASLVNRTNAVRFYSDVECVLIDAARESRNEADSTAIAEDVYNEINMILAE